MSTPKPVRAVDLVQLRVWSERLCALEVTEPRLVLGALGVGAAPAAHIGGVGLVDPPPSGVSRCELGVVQGRFRSLRFTFRSPSVAPAITLALLEDALGAGMPLRRSRPLQPYQVAYRVVLRDAPYTCDVIATVAGPPRPRSVVTDVMLRRRRAVSRAA